MCNDDYLSYQVEVTDSLGTWQAAASTPDTTVLLILPDTGDSTRLVRVRSVIME
ncbi:MAG: hypothetical protein IPG71_09450 [bacterium]|nr:hypothetical protein [bacterium]